MAASDFGRRDMVRGRPVRGLGLAAAIAVYLVGGCPAPQGPVKLQPTLLPLPFQAITAGSVQRSGLAIAGGALALKVVDGHDGQRVAGAQISVLGPTLGSAMTGPTYDLLFSPLASNSYAVRVAAPGYVTVMQSGILVSNQSTTSMDVHLAPSAGPVTGRVVDASGNPVVGARVVSSP
ncbi:MAG: hypothetical protein KGR26_09095, partial [Cyanobacteria bacterium REEB65]|nr:hypothetical protein [Cyanobacteria bacterium REEB65]